MLDEAGLCIGMIVDSFESSHEGGVSIANSAIPAEHILKFTTPHLLD